MRKVIVAKDLDYGSNKAAGTENAAHLAIDLAVGAIGVYGIPNTSANNKEKMTLVIEGGSDAAGVIPDASFDGIGVHIAVGIELGCQTSGEIDIAGVVKSDYQVFVA